MTWVLVFQLMPLALKAVVSRREEAEMKNYYVYILANVTNTTIYVGVTGDLLRRIYQHKNDMDSGSFTAKYQVHKLVYYECTTDVYSALSREKQLKSWNRKRKNKLVESMNPSWRDLYDGLLP